MYRLFIFCFQFVRIWRYRIVQGGGGSRSRTGQRATYVESTSRIEWKTWNKICLLDAWFLRKSSLKIRRLCDLTRPSAGQLRANNQQEIIARLRISEKEAKWNFSDLRPRLQGNQFSTRLITRPKHTPDAFPRLFFAGKRTTLWENCILYCWLVFARSLNPVSIISLVFSRRLAKFQIFKNTRQIFQVDFPFPGWKHVAGNFSLVVLRRISRMCGDYRRAASRKSRRKLARKRGACGFVEFRKSLEVSLTQKIADWLLNDWIAASIVDLAARTVAILVAF